jgi:ADP-ribose pyrophosphatase YjhB (NUDIX family)
MRRPPQPVDRPPTAMPVGSPPTDGFDPSLEGFDPPLEAFYHAHPTDAAGVPAWLAASLNFCSRCGASLDFGPIEGEERERLACASCGFIAYVNPRLVVTTLPVTDAGEVVLLRRGIEPGYGEWAQPGGFLEIDETVNEGAVRETFEETGLVVEPGEIVGLYSRPQAAIVVVAFEARITGGESRTSPESLEVMAFAPEAIPWSGIAFYTTTWALRDWIRLRHPELHPRIERREAGR